MLLTLQILRAITLTVSTSVIGTQMMVAGMTVIMTKSPIKTGRRNGRKPIKRE